MMFGRIVVLPEYRKQGLGRLVVTEAEKWARELGCRKAVLDSRDVALIVFTWRRCWTERISERFCGAERLWKTD